VFIEELNEVPAGSTVIFSAHGVSKAVRAEAEQRGLKVFDATCPLVTKVHVEVGKMRNQAREVVMIGHKGHPEVEGTMGQSPDGMYLVDTVEDVARLQVRDPAQLSFVTQTTLSVDDASRVIASPQGAVSPRPGAEEGRHLLRHTESPGCRQGAGRTVRSGYRRW
jgi:4-hydroxy-3-methylbut-2-enyl diphosphate reductase